MSAERIKKMSKLKNTILVVKHVQNKNYHKLKNFPEFYMEHIKTTSVVKNLFEESNDSSVLRHFINHVDDINVECKEGKRIIHYMVQHLELEEIKHIVRSTRAKTNPIEMNHTTVDGDTVLHILVKMLNTASNTPQKINRAVKIIRYLVKSKKILDNFTISDKNGLKPLHYVAKFSNVTVGRILIENGANINEITNTSECLLTPLQLAINPNLESIDFIKFLLINGCNPTDLDVEIAKRKNCNAIAKLFLENQILKIKS